MLSKFFSLECLQNDCILTSDFWKEPATGEVIMGVCDVDFKLDLVIDYHSDDLRVRCSLDSFKSA